MGIIHVIYRSLLEEMWLEKNGLTALAAGVFDKLTQLKILVPSAYAVGLCRRPMPSAIDIIPRRFIMSLLWWGGACGRVA